MQDLPNGGGRRSKHWPPGAGDPRYAIASGVARGGGQGGPWPPGAGLGGGAGPACRGEF